MAICTQPESKTGLRAISVCSGIGGLDLGIHIAGELGFAPRTKTVCYIEREAYCAASLVARMEDKTLGEAPIWDDLESFPNSRFSGRVDVIFGGIPCQGYSAAGKGLGKKDERDLWPSTRELLRATGAQIVFIENVSRFRSHKDGLARVLRGLAEDGFDAVWGCFSCEMLGAPHRRERLFLLAYTECGLIRLKQGWSGWPRSGPSDTTEPAIPRADLAHPNEQYDDRPGIEREIGWRQPPDSSEQLAHPNSSRRQEGGGSPQESRPVQPGSFWPPDRDIRNWNGVPAIRWPSCPKDPTESQLCDLADGYADWLESANDYRADQLRALGNAVSPPVGAVAWSVLCQRAIEGSQS